VEETTTYTVEITPEAELFYYEILIYLYQYHSEQSANRKSEELLNLAISLEKLPERGTLESRLQGLGKKHRFILYSYTPNKAIKIIYFIDHSHKIVYVTDFFPCQMDVRKIIKRTR